MRRRAAGGVVLLQLLYAAALPAQTIVLNGATVIDGTGAPPRPNTTIVIIDDSIADVFPTGTRQVRGKADVIDVRGKFIIPGLIDSHVHLVTDPATTDPRDVVLRRLRQALYGGVTTVRDMAGDARMLADLARAAATREIESPGIYYSALWAGPIFFSDQRTIGMTRGSVAGREPWSFAVTDTVDLRSAVARARGTGATAIKIYTYVEPRLFARIAGEAHRQGMRVWSHAFVRPMTPVEVVTAGSDAVSHADMFVCVVHECSAPPTISTYEKTSATHPRLAQLYRQMHSTGTILDPTLLVFHMLADEQQQTREQRTRLQAREEFAASVTRAAHEAGVEIVAGTDSIGDGDMQKLPNVHLELALLVTKAGMSPLAALRAGTLAGAIALGLEQTHGSIAPGKRAHLLVLDADPTLDIKNTRSIHFVLKQGKVYRK
jgi:cytosine/adenosine deaminase-related metal-dependent hydrolase